MDSRTARRASVRGRHRLDRNRIDQHRPGAVRLEAPLAEAVPVESPAEAMTAAEPEVSRALVVAGARWRGLLQVVQQVLSVLATLVLARLLTPSDFGVVAAAMSVLTFLSLASAWGFGAVIIRRPQVDEALLRAALTANLLLAFTLTAIGVLFSPLVARLIGAPGAAPAIAAMMPVMLLIGSSGVSAALLERRMQFGRMTVVGVAATVVYVVVELGLAVVGLSYWAVIIGFLAMQAVQAVGYLVAAGWRPGFASPRQMIRHESRFSLGFFANEVSMYANKNLDYWVVAATLGTAALGAYYIAFVLPTMLRIRITAVVQQLLFPVFSRLRSDPDRSRRVYASVMEFQAAIGIPSMVGLAVVATPLVEVFFGSQWQTSADPMRWIALAAAVDFLATAVAQAALAHGLLMRSFVVNAARAAVFCVVLLVVALAGTELTGVAIAVFITSLVALALGQVIIGRPLGLHLGLVLAPLLRICALSAGMAVLAWAALRALDSAGVGSLGQLVGAVLVGAASYVLLGLIFAPRAFRNYRRDLVQIMGLSALRRRR
jgi:O-antigen/teichoic acid export membrane protein